MALPVHNSHVGPRWEAFWAARGRDGHDERLLPKVDVAIKIYELSDINALDCTFNCVFVVLLDWVDPSLEMLEIPRSAEAIDWTQHFFPRIELVDAKRDMIAELGQGGDVPRVRPRDPVTGECNHVTLTAKMKATIKSRFDFRRYPFETQVLQLLIKAHTVSDGKSFANGKRHGFVTLADPTRWRYDDAHEIVPNADWLVDWDITSLAASPCGFHEGVNDGYKVQVLITRDSTSIMWNQALSLAVIDLLSMVSYGVHPIDLADRSSIVFTMLLTAMAFKFVVSDSLPSVPYLTTLDRFMISSFVVIAIQGLLHWFVAEAEASLCYFDGADFMTKAVDSGHPNTTHNPSDGEQYTNGHAHGIWKGREYPHNPTPDACLAIHWFDRLLMLCHVGFVIAKYATLVCFYRSSRRKRAPKVGELQDLGRLEEFHSERIMLPFSREKVEQSTVEAGARGLEPGTKKEGEQGEEEAEMSGGEAGAGVGTVEIEIVSRAGGGRIL